MYEYIISVFVDATNIFPMPLSHDGFKSLIFSIPIKKAG
jgi:hypothetical protein